MVHTTEVTGDLDLSWILAYIAEALARPCSSAGWWLGLLGLLIGMTFRGCNCYSIYHAELTTTKVVTP